MSVVHVTQSVWYSMMTAHSTMSNLIVKVEITLQRITLAQELMDLSLRLSRGAELRDGT